MQWFATNWFWVLIGIAFVAMHLFGHGGHGGQGGQAGQGGHGGGGRQRRDDEEETDDTPGRGANRSPGGHQH